MGLACSGQAIFTAESALKRLGSMVGHLGLTRNGDGTIKDIHNGGPAYRSAIAASDTIKSVNGVLLDEANTLAGVLKKARAGDFVSVGFASDGMDKSEEIELAAAGETVEGVRALRLMAGVATNQLASVRGFNDSMLVEAAVADPVSEFVDGIISDLVESSEAVEELKAISASLGFVPVSAEGGVKVTNLEASVSVLEGSCVCEGGQRQNAHTIQT